jgi:hypothetical protein
VILAVETHSHEEADTLMPLHVIDTLSDSAMEEVDVHCADADVRVLLVDLVANYHHGAMTLLSFVKT